MTHPAPDGHRLVREVNRIGHSLRVVAPSCVDSTMDSWNCGLIVWLLDRLYRGATQKETTQRACDAHGRLQASDLGPREAASTNDAVGIDFFLLWAGRAPIS